MGQDLLSYGIFEDLDFDISHHVDQNTYYANALQYHCVKGEL